MGNRAHEDERVAGKKKRKRKERRCIQLGRQTLHNTMWEARERSVSFHILFYHSSLVLCWPN